MRRQFRFTTHIGFVPYGGTELGENVEPELRC